MSLSLSALPALNATLNGLCAVLLVAGRVANVRRETYETILSVLEGEIDSLEAEEDTEASAAQLEALRSLRHVIERLLRRATEPRASAEPDAGNGNGAKPRKRTVTID